MQFPFVLYSTQKAEHTLKKAEVVSREREELGFEYRDPLRRLQILMSLGRVSLKAHKTGYALESFEKVQYRMIVIWPCTLDFVISVFYDFTPLYYDRHQAVSKGKYLENSRRQIWLHYWLGDRKLPYKWKNIAANQVNKLTHNLTYNKTEKNS